MHRHLRWLPALLLLPVVLLAFLPKEPDPVVIPSVFRWRNSAWLEGAEEEVIHQTGVQRVYLKLLDIDWNMAHGAHPIAVLHVPYQWRSPYYGLYGSLTDKVELVPCIYITNNTFQKITDSEVDELARNLLRKLRLECPPVIHGVMLDCDWSPKTKAKFFRLARIMNDSLEVPVTATIRLHQYAQPSRTGVPPVDRGMLMPYNVGRIMEPGSVNSIFDRATAEPYFKTRQPYPLPLDIGLPAFSWGVQFRKGAFVGILREEQVNDALNAGLLSGEPPGMLHVVTENNDAMPELHLGDRIRVERITPATLAQVVDLARTAVNSDTLAVVYFEAGAGTFQRMTVEEVRTGWMGFGTIRSGGYFDRERQARQEQAAMDSARWSAADTTAVSPVDSTSR
ncbi:MAG: hypothetical protein ACO1NQ_13195 [Flavobacteriales bacterium]